MRKILLFLFSTFLVFNVTLAQSETRHPRLWLTPESLELYRSWATDSNPLYSESLLPMAESAREEMDAGNILNGDTGGNSYEDYASENYASLFAFMSQIHPDESQRAEYAERARTLLLHVINEAAKGVAPGEPFRDTEFSYNDRSRWYGVSFALTVDWIYPILSADDKALIRSVFLRWMSELEVAPMTNNNHPEPVGVINDPVLTSDLDLVRWAGNNYYTAHMRNMGMMALAFDPADDPDGALQKYLNQATGAWLYVEDYLLRTEAAGGFGTEGFEYSPQSVGYVAQFLLALHTAGITDTVQYGEQITSLESNPFWNDVFPAYFNSLSPATVQNPDYDIPMYQPAWYGSGQQYLNPDWIELFGILGVYDQLRGETNRLNAIRWLQTETPLGGAAALIDRSNDAGEFYKNILYFMLFDPTAPTPVDPRADYPTTWYGSGMRRLLSRTDWTPDATWFTYSLSWDRVDHQAANGNAIEFYRDGEWLTKVRVGYDLDYIASDNMNTITVQNDPLDRDDFRLMLWERGSQWLYSANNPPQPIYSYNDDYVYAYGDSTALYNSDYEELHGVTHVSRSVLWLKPDVVVIYDRAETASADRPKRFMLNFPANGIVSGNQITMTTDNGQQLYITSLLPAGATMNVTPLVDEISSAPATFEPMRYRLEVASDGAQTVRFLHVLQGADAEITALPTALISSDDGSYQIAVVGNNAVAFAVVADAAFTGTIYRVPNTVDTHFISGLAAGAAYDVTMTADGTDMIVTITAGSTYTADGAGVLMVKPA